VGVGSRASGGAWGWPHPGRDRPSPLPIIPPIVTDCDTADTLLCDWHDDTTDKTSACQRSSTLPAIEHTASDRAHCQAHCQRSSTLPAIEHTTRNRPNTKRCQAYLTLFSVLGFLSIRRSRREAKEKLVSVNHARSQANSIGRFNAKRIFSTLCLTSPIGMVDFLPSSRRPAKRRQRNETTSRKKSAVTRT
jgi:hypothetical protein